MPNPNLSTCIRMPELSEGQQHRLCGNPWTECKRPSRDCLALAWFALKWLEPKWLRYDDTVDADDNVQHRVP